ncbi:unnamed protein product [Clonostachys rosea]|uniref:Cyclin N-terminal domain-containing protein n=1 Tax=Bionectria ochroleuca TaxID=29856 RepID=A0ABY6UPP2_BIOOC|nr:unnamed protein product [Clonostachys rosea]
MKYDADISPGFVPSLSNAVYSSSLASFASTSAVSVWSDASSQTSEDSSVSANSSDSESCDSYCFSKQTTDSVRFQQQTQQTSACAVPLEQRQNPRRTSASFSSRNGAPPSLVRQSDRKVNFVDSLVDSSTQIVETIWPLSSVVCRSELRSKAVLPLRTFIQETLRRSRTSYSTLQVALYYLILIKPHVPTHDFTMEQPEDRHADRALQCGRRMFLAALILASKYLQDRNYSARAWSKISGLNTQEINQNEIAFLLAVNWKLHIADEVFQRWTDIVLKYTPPPSPPSPGGISQVVSQQTADWKYIILGLVPDLTNIEELLPSRRVSSKLSDLSPVSPRSILNMASESHSQSTIDALPIPRSISIPTPMEPTPISVYTSGRSAPGLGLFTTTRLSQQTSGIRTPAASSTFPLPGKCSAMGFAIGHVNTVSASQYLERHPAPLSSSPQSYCPARRSSLANSISTASSPDSMVSDTSRTSRSSSISSASSLASATANSKLSSASRFRGGKLCKEKTGLRLTVPSVPESYDEECFASSPDFYTGPVGKLGDWSAETPMAGRDSQLRSMAQDAASDAARTLQELHSHRAYSTTPTGSKRSRLSSIDDSLHESVRDLLNGRYDSDPAWSDRLVRPRSDPFLQVSSYSELSRSAKRVCCSAEAASGYEASSIHSGLGIRRPGLWHGILN